MDTNMHLVRLQCNRRQRKTAWVESRLFLPQATSRQVYKEKLTVKCETDNTDNLILMKNILHLIRINIFTYVYIFFERKKIPVLTHIFV